MDPTPDPTIEVPDGPGLRLRGPTDAPAIVLFGGSTHRDVAGTWSPTTEWLARGLARQGGDWRIAEVRYRHSSWQRLETSIADGVMALDTLRALGSPARVAIGFSLGGAVAVSVADDPEMHGVIGLAPWLPPRVDLRRLAGRRLLLLHGSLDARPQGFPGIPASSSEWAAARARELGLDVEYTPVTGGVHGVAVRAPWGGLIPLPRARRWTRVVAAELRHLRTAVAASGRRGAAERRPVGA